MAAIDTTHTPLTEKAQHLIALIQRFTEQV
jgi:hypothetical protein